jgi:hypothetical protein
MSEPTRRSFTQDELNKAAREWVKQKCAQGVISKPDYYQFQGLMAEFVHDIGPESHSEAKPE